MGYRKKEIFFLYNIGYLRDQEYIMPNELYLLEVSHNSAEVANFN